MPTVTIQKNSSKISVPVSVQDLAESIWRLPPKERETLEDILEKNFVRRVLKRSKEISRLRKEKKLLSLRDVEREFAR